MVQPAKAPPAPTSVEYFWVGGERGRRGRLKKLCKQLPNHIIIFFLGLLLLLVLRVVLWSSKMRKAFHFGMHKELLKVVIVKLSY